MGFDPVSLGIESGIGASLLADAAVAGFGDVAAGLTAGELAGGIGAGALTAGEVAAGAGAAGAGAAGISALYGATGLDAAGNVIGATAADAAAGGGISELYGATGLNAAGEVTGTAAAGAGSALADSAGSTAVADQFFSGVPSTSGIFSDTAAYDTALGSSLESGAGSGSAGFSAAPVAESPLYNAPPTAETLSQVTAPASESGSWTDALTKGMTTKGALDALAKYGPLGLSAANIASQKKLAGQSGQKIAGIGATQNAVAQQQISDAQAGKINPADQAAIDQWKQQAKAQALQYFAKAGLSDSSMAQQSLADIDAKGAQMFEQARQQLLQAGISTLNITDKYQLAAVNAEMQASQASSQQMGQFLNTYGQWMSQTPKMTSGTTSATTTQPAATTGGGGA